MNHADNIRPRRHQSGFTLIELLLAMTFIAALLLTIALTIVQIAKVYNRGLILKEVNVTSRSINDELTRAFRSNTSFSTDPDAHEYVAKDWGGRLCIGQYSYVWNYGKALASHDANRNRYTGTAVAGNTVNGSSEISFVKVPDAGGTLCTPNGNGVYPAVPTDNTVELLRSGDHSLAIHAFSVTSSDSAKDALSAQELYKIDYTIGTSDINALNADQSSCKAPGEAGADENYCAVSEFTLVLRAVSGVN